MLQLTVNDRQSYKITHRTVTDEGFLHVPAKVARTGIQQYLARELQLPGDPNRIVRVMRPEDSVFEPEYLESFDGADITLDHPPEFVNAKNYQTYSRGVVRGPGVRTGDDWIECNIIVKDAAATKAINDGKAEVSVGYTSVYDDNVPEGADYEFIQRNMRVNHVAIVDRARAGSLARVYDNQRGLIMPVIITTDSGRDVDVADAANAQVVADAYDRLKQRVVSADAAVDSIKAVADGLKEKVAELEAKTSDAAITERVKAIAQVTADARKVAGEKFTCDSLVAADIQRAALKSIRPTIEWADKSEAYVQAAFDMALETPVEDAAFREQVKRVGDGITTTKVLDADAIYAKHKASLSQQWKGETK